MNKQIGALMLLTVLAGMVARQLEVVPGALAWGVLCAAICSLFAYAYIVGRFEIR